MNMPAINLEEALARANALIGSQAEENDRLVKSLNDEITRLKTGIKKVDTAMIVDGNDMADWGWSTRQISNWSDWRPGQLPGWQG